MVPLAVVALDHKIVVPVYPCLRTRLEQRNLEVREVESAWFTLDILADGRHCRWRVFAMIDGECLFNSHFLSVSRLRRVPMKSMNVGDSPSGKQGCAQDN